MAVQRAAFNGLSTDLPPDQLGNSALALKNMVPSSAAGVRPRPGCDLRIAWPSSIAADRREIDIACFAGDPNFTTFVVCFNIISNVARVEGIFEAHLGEAIYNDVVSNGGIFGIYVFSGAAAAAYLPSCVQFGNKALLYYPDQRPLVIMQSTQFSSPTASAIQCGIQASIASPIVTESSDNANNIVYDATIPSLNYMQIGYCYYSSARNVYSQPSPLFFYTIPATAKKLVIHGFFGCRDNIADNMIDFIAVCVRSGTNGGLMHLAPDMLVSITPTTLAGTVSTTAGSPTVTGSGTAFSTDFVVGDSIYIDDVSYIVSATPGSPTSLAIYGGAESTLAGQTYQRAPRLTFDLSPDQLQLGIDLNALAGAMYIPPAVKYCERYQERIWLAGQLQGLTFGATNLTVVKANLTGTLTCTNGSAGITGSGDSLFLTELKSFDIIGVYSENSAITGLPVLMTVGTVNSNTSITCTTAWPETTQSLLKAVRLYRGNASARLTTDADAFTLAHLYMNVYVAGKSIGQISDVLNAREAYLFSDTNADIAATDNWVLDGFNDRIWPSSYVTTPIPTTFPECVQLNDYQLLTQALDQGQALTGLKSTLDELRIAFDSSFVRMIGGSEPDTPVPNLRQAYGLAGCIAPRSLCNAPSGEMAWIGVEGIFIDAMGTSYAASMSGIKNVCVELGCQALFRGGQWIARDDIPNIVMCYSRELNGFVFGNFTINGVAGFWGMLTLAPQYGIWLFDGQSFSSNLIEYLNNGRGEILGGDSLGRVKRLLYDKTLVDLSPLNTSTAAYTCMWREGYTGKPDNSQWSMSRVLIPGIIAPDMTTIAGTLDFYRSDFLEREASYLAAGATYSVAFTGKDLQPANNIPLTPNRSRFQSMAYSFLSTAGATTPASQICRPMEITNYLILESGE